MDPPQAFNFLSERLIFVFSKPALSFCAPRLTHLGNAFFRPFLKHDLHNLHHPALQPHCAFSHLHVIFRVPSLNSECMKEAADWHFFEAFYLSLLRSYFQAYPVFGSNKLLQKFSTGLEVPMATAPTSGFGPEGGWCAV